MLAPVSPFQNPFWQQHGNFSVYMARMRGSNFHEASLLELQGRIIFVLFIQVIFFGYNSVLVDGGFTTNTRARARGS